jgi:hypothetical protein
VLYAQVDGSFSVWDPAYVFAPREVWDGLQPEPDAPPLCNGLIRDWARWQDGGGEAFRHLAAVLNALSPDAREKLEPGELTRISLDDARDIPTLRMPYGQDVPVLHASAGMRRIIALAYLLVWCWEEHVRASKLLGQPTTRQAIFLIDEIEAHLHPRWQRVIARALLEVVQQLSSAMRVQIITATHSPLVMASVEPWFDDEKDAWFDLDLVAKRGGGYKVQLEKRQWVRHGDASRWLTSEAFDLRAAGSLEREEALEEAAIALSDEHFDRDRARKLDARLREVLGDTDPFWMRWRFAGEKRGWLP